MNLKALRLILFLIGCLIPPFSYGQGSIPVLTWRSHFSYRSVISIVDADQRIYAASPNGLFFVNKQEFSVEKLTKNDGLSDVSIGAIGYDSETTTLVIGYSNGNIDLVDLDNITNLTAFRDASLIGSKSFNDITFNNGLSYLSTDQGVLVIDLDREELIESYQNLGTGGERLPVFATAFFQGNIYAATSKGILSASLSAQVNRQDFNNWQRARTDQVFSGIQANDNTLLASSGEELYLFDNQQWSLWQNIGFPIVQFSLNQGNAVVLTPEEVFTATESIVSSSLSLEESEGTAAAFLVEGNNFWLGDGLNGLRRFTNGSGQSFSPTGPASDNAWLFSKLSDQVTLVHGGFSESLRTLGRPGELSGFSTETGWSGTPIAISENDRIFDLVDIETLDNEAGTTTYLASFDRGLISLNGPQSTIVNETSPNSTLAVMAGSVNMTAIASENGNIWMTNYGSETSLHRWEPTTDTWTAYSFSSSFGRFPINVFVAPNGDKWMPIDPERGGGILVFNETSGEERYLNTNGGQGGLPGRSVTSLALDDDFFLWVGTNEGIAFFPNLISVLDGNSLTASVPIFENRLLLRDEFITSVVVDPGNRKWFGTRNNGLWLFSETGEELIFRFTAENSPLPSDNITALFIDKESGELFVGTDKGSVSFRSDATEGTARHENVTIYPNPARSNSTEQVVINGLVNNALVKITDVSGKLVREVRAQGSTALWNTRDYNGRSVKTGVYLVFSSNADGTETFVGKIAVI